MNALETLIAEARKSAGRLRDLHSGGEFASDRAALEEASRLEIAATLSEHALFALGLHSSRRAIMDDDGA